MKHIPSFDEFVNEDYVNEGMSKSAIKKQIKDIDSQIDNEEGGDGEPLTDETLAELEKEKARLEKLLESAESINEEDYDTVQDVKRALGTGNRQSDVEEYLGYSLRPDLLRAMKQARVIR